MGSRRGLSGRRGALRRGALPGGGGIDGTYLARRRTERGEWQRWGLGARLASDVLAECSRALGRRYL